MHLFSSRCNNFVEVQLTVDRGYLNAKLCDINLGSCDIADTVCLACCVLLFVCKWRKSWDVVAKLFFAVLGYILITAGSIPILFIAVFSSAHSTTERTQEGSSLILFVIFAVLYVLFCYGFVSLANGGFIKPWKLFTCGKEIKRFQFSDRTIFKNRVFGKCQKF